MSANDSSFDLCTAFAMYVIRDWAREWKGPIPSSSSSELKAAVHLLLEYVIARKGNHIREGCKGN